jgi:hypothetical protein
MKCLSCTMAMQSVTTATLLDTVAKSIVLTLDTSMITDSLPQHTKMICKECGVTLEGFPSITLECTRCGNGTYSCQCQRKFGYTPERTVHCRSCGREDIIQIDTSEFGWRDMEV